MLNPFNRVLKVESQDNNTLSLLRTRFIQALAATGVVASIAGLVAQTLSAEQAPFGYVATTGVAAASLGLLYLLQRRMVALAALLTVVIFAFTVLVSPPYVYVLVASIALISAAVLVSLPVYLIVSVLVFGKGFANIYSLAPDFSSGVPLDVAETIVVLLALGITSWTVRYFIGRTQAALREAQRTSSLLTATADISQIINSLLDLDALFTESVNMIRERFAFYHAQVFILDDNGRDALLVASTGEAGRQLLERGHRLAVGSTSVIGRVTSLGEAVIARDTDSDAVHRRNELLPDTRAELAVPIIIEGRIAGALDVQSTQINAFNENDVRALQTLADLLGTAIRNARLFEAQQRSVQEQQRLFFESEANLREIQRLNQRLTRTGWEDYIHQSRAVQGVALHDQQIVHDVAWTEALIQASQQRQPVTQQANGKPAQVAVPILLRGEVIGAIEVEPGADIDLNEAADMARAIAQRLAVSLDNARLFEQTQAAMAAEQQITQIVGQYQAVTTVDDLLSITLTELGRSLNAERGAIRLGTLAQDGDKDA